MTVFRAGAITAVLAGCCIFIPLAATAQTPAAAAKPLKVCADPNNLPLSNDKGEGYENKIAEAMARDFGRPVEYTYFPQRMGFVRMTLRAKVPNTEVWKCDLIIGVPTGYELTASTKPYMHSTYAMVFRKSANLGDVRTPDDLLKLPPERLKTVRFAIFGQSPAADWLLSHQLFEQSIAYRPQTGDPNDTPADTVIRDFKADKIDVAIVWGPMAGFIVNQSGKPDDWVMAPFMPNPAIRFDYQISMGMRFGEKDWKETIENWIAASGDKINQILLSYRVPLIDANGALVPPVQ